MSVELLRSLAQGGVSPPNSARGGDAAIILRDALDLSDLRHFERTWGLQLPGDYRDFLAYTNGCDLFTLDLCSLAGVAVYAEHGLIGFHNWGNGDYDCVRIVGERSDIVFMNHGPAVTVAIASSFTDWLTRIVAEYQAHGDILHPGDYQFAPPRRGVYAHVLQELRGVTCELNDRLSPE